MEVVGREARRVAPVVVLGKVVGRAQTAGEEAAAERGVGDDGDAELAAGAQQVVVLNVEREGRVLDLDGVNVGDLAGAAQGGGAALAQAEVLDLAGVLELLHGADGDLDGLVLVEAVAVVQVDVGQAQAGEGLVDGAVDVGWVVAGAALAGGGVEGDGELGGQENVVALAWVLLEPSAEEVLAVAVDYAGTSVWLGKRRVHD